MENKLIFLSQEWIHEVTKVVQAARIGDEEFKRMTSNFSLNLLYKISGLPAGLRQLYLGKDEICFFIKLEKGSVKKLQIGTNVPNEKIDFTVSSNYDVAKRIFTGELNLATAFFNQQFKVEPQSRLYRNPRFAARAIVVGNRIFKIARQVPTHFLSDEIVSADQMHKNV
ncbi:MAG: SCP2 sterol-binding domain-containing protein [Thaumarchaeota archaeon]|nr:SCP2 sterol-binding domain-containing protein [Candidatus Terraquivivens yellowstonensis]